MQTSASAQGTREDNLVTDRTSFESKSGRAIPLPSPSIVPPTTVQSDPEEVGTKTKTRSRFSSAFRKLSLSTRRKDRPLPKDSVPRAAFSTTAIESIASGGGEECPEAHAPRASSSEPKARKTSTLAKRFLLGGLKKPKPGPEKGPLPTEKTEEPSAAVANQEEPPPQTNPEDELGLAIVEPETTETSASGAEASGEPSDKDYLEPTDPTTTTTNNTNRAPEAEATGPSERPSLPSSTAPNTPAKKKKLRAKGTTTSTAAPPAPPATQRSTQSRKNLSATRTENDEQKLIITQSSRDTPPRERAPTRPHRVATNATAAAAATQPPTSTGAVRKTTITTRAAIKFVSAPKLAVRSKGAQSASAVPTVASAKLRASGCSDCREESELMHNPQRGHRFPKPTTTITTTTAAATTTGSNRSSVIGNTVPAPTATATATATTTTTETRFRAQPGTATTSPTNIEFQLEANASPQAQPSQPAKGKPQSLESDRSEGLPPSTDATPAPRSPSTPTSAPTPASASASASVAATHQRHPSLSTAPSELSTLGSNAGESVERSSSYTLDDYASLPESVQPSEHSISGDSPSFAKEQLKVRFAVGRGEERAPLQGSVASSCEALFERDSCDSYKSVDTDSPSPASEISRRRIPYVAQPTLYDELESVERKRRSYRHQEALRGLSPDSEYDSGDSGQQQMPAFGDLTMEPDMEPTIVTATNMEKREHLYKILVIGELGTGKTSFIKRYVHQFFSQNYRATIGVDFALKVLHWDPNTIVRLQLWDIAGQERFGNMTRVYYKEAVGAFIVFDVTRSATFDCVSKWKEDLDSKVQLPDGSPIPCMLLANKCDQEKQGVVTSPERMDEYVKENGFAGWFETSAKENINIDEAARALVNKILLNDKLISTSDLSDSDKFNLNNSVDPSAAEAKSKCSC